jgi:hypothetical protein
MDMAVARRKPSVNDTPNRANAPRERNGVVMDAHYSEARPRHSERGLSMTSKALLAVSMGIACGTLASAAAAQPDPQAPLKVSHIEFTATPAPVNTDEMTTPYTTSNAVVTLVDGSQKSFPLSYRVLHRSGEYVNGWYAGLIVDKNGKPVLRSPADTKGDAARGPFLAPGQDGTSLLMIPGAVVAGLKGNPLFLIDQLEYDTDGQNVDPHQGPVDLYGRLPMALNLTLLDQDPESGVLTPVKLANVDVAAVEGVWIPCNGSTTPWMTHLGSEEYEPDAQVFENEPLEAMNLYRGTQGKTAAEGGANPYRGGGEARRLHVGRQALLHGPAVLRAGRRHGRRQDRVFR